MAKLFNIQNQQFEDIDEKDIEPAIKSGSHEFIAGKTIQVISPEGEFGEMPSEGVNSALNSGFRLANASDRLNYQTKLQQQEELKIAGESPELAAIAGAARGATFGLSDVVAKALGQEQALSTLKEANPMASLGGELVGAVASPLGGVVLKGASKLASTAISKTGLPNTVQAALKASETGGLIAKTQAGAMQLGEKAAQGALEGAIGGTAFGVGSGISEAALGNPDDIAEHILLGGLDGLKMGAILGGAIPVGVGALAGGVKLLTSLGEKTTSKIGGALVKARADEDTAKVIDELLKDPNMSYKLSNAAQEQVKIANIEAKKSIKEITNSIKSDIKQAKDPQELIQYANSAKAALDNTEQAMSKTYDDAVQLFKAENPTLTTSRSIEVLPSLQMLSTSMENRGIPGSARLSQKLSNLAEDLKGARELNAGDDIAKLREIRSNIDEILYGKGLTPEAKQVIKTARDQVKSEIQNFPVPELRDTFIKQDADWYNYLEKLKKPFYDKFVSKLKADGTYAIDESKIVRQMNSIKENEKRALMNSFDSFANYNAQLKPEAQISQNILDSLNNLVNARAEVIQKRQIPLEKLSKIESIKQTPGSNIDKYQLLKKELGLPDKEFEQFNKLSKELTALQSLQKAGSESNIPFMAGAGLHTLGVPIAMTIPATGILASLFNPYGTLKQVANIRDISNRIQKNLDNHKYQIAQNLTKKTLAPVSAIQTSENRKNWKQDAKIYATLNNPAEVTQLVQQQTESLKDNPQIQQAVQTKLTNAYTHLANTLPQPINKPTDRITPQTVIAEPSKNELNKWYQRKQVIEQPESLLTKIANGEIPTKEEIETFQTIFPNSYNTLLDTVNNALLESKAEIPYSKRIQLAKLFGKSLDKQTDSAYAQNMQKSLFAPSEGGGFKNQGGSVGSGNLDKRLVTLNETTMDRLLSKG